MLTLLLLHLVVYLAFSTEMSEVDYLQFLSPRTCSGYDQATPSKVV
jgi:hypothetical protein